MVPPAPHARKRRVYDTRITGFCVEGRRTGTKTFILRYSDARRRRREVVIGRHGDITADQARKRAAERRAEIALGGDPAGERERLRGVPTLAAFATDRYLPHARDTTRSSDDYEAMLRLRILPALGRLHLDEVTAARVASFRRGPIDAGLSSGRVNRHLAVLRRMFNLALKWGLYQGANPAQSPGMLREQPREIFLAGPQLRALMAALADESDRAAAGAITLLALTGARRSEVLRARWQHVDLKRGLLTVPLAKSGRHRHVVLSGAAIGVLLLQPRVLGREFVFASPRLPGRPIQGVRAAWARAKAAAGLPAETRLHDLRHTFASLCVNGSVLLYEVSKLLGHSSQATTARYAHLRDDRLLAAANAVGAIATDQSGGE
jgi:integrase